MRPLLRLGRAAIRHPRRMITGWGLVVVASFIAAPVLFSSLTSDMRGADSAESGRTDERLDELVAHSGAIVAPVTATALTMLAGITASVFFRPPDVTTNP